MFDTIHHIAIIGSDYEKYILFASEQEYFEFMED